MNHSNNKPAGFRALRCFNDPQLRPLAGLKGRIDHRTTAFFPKDTLHRKVISALADDGLLPLKEVCESFEFFERTRRAVRAESIVDLAAGHGLTGLLFGVFEREVQQVILVDKRPSPSHAAILDAMCSVAPWLRAKVRWVEGRIEDATDHLDPGTSVVAVHACGPRTDRCLDVALACRGHVAVMPCCYPNKGDAPHAFYQSLGGGLAADIHRTYRLEASGYTVRWSQIPSVITPMNRIVLGRRPEPA